ncbi:MAG TPA: ABC transporter permease [Acidimicrobiales bacterium]|nr:ABC transporter permease [Acidimicrobiales bacterium]
MIAEFWDYVSDADNWWGESGLLFLTWNHLRLAFFATLVATLVALPPAVSLGHRRKGGAVAVGLVNLSRAIPSFAVLVLVVPFSLRYGFGLGFWPTFVPLVLLALPPIFANTYTGLAGVDRSTVEAARAMGMRSREVLRSVEIPAGLPLMITGLRIAATQVVATTTLGALVAYPCLGTPIVRSLQATRDNGELLAGAGLVALLALLTDLGFSLLERRLSPWRRSTADPAPVASIDESGLTPVT